MFKLFKNLYIYLELIKFFISFFFIILLNFKINGLSFKRINN